MIDELLKRCVHCGLCLPVCPTYRLTGSEASSPRGRIHLMAAVADGRLPQGTPALPAQLSECLNCRACEAACPSGVSYGALLELGRDQAERQRGHELPARPLPARLLRGLGLRLFRSLGLLRLLVTLLWLYQRSGLQALLRRSGLLRALRLAETERLLPPLSLPLFTAAEQTYPAEGPARHTVALFTGCVMGAAFPRVHEATVRVLQRSGCTVIVPPGQGCCGALHVHGGDLAGGRDLLRRNLAAFAALPDEVDAIVVNAAGCGSLLKEAGHPHLLGDEAGAFPGRVRDIHEWLAQIGVPVGGLSPLPLRVTYQDPCHLAHAQRIREAPRQLLRLIPGLDLREMAEGGMCCGSAGTYNLSQPAMSARLGRRKIDHALDTAPQVIATANPGCAMQLRGELARRGVAVPVRFVVELLDESYRRATPASPAAPSAGSTCSASSR